MGKNIRQLMLGFILVLSGLMFSQAAIANEGYGSVSIVKVDTKKQIIVFDKYQFKYDKNTIIYDLSGNKLDINDIKAGMTARVGYNPAQRFVGYRTLTTLHIKTFID